MTFSGSSERLQVTDSVILVGTPNGCGTVWLECVGQGWGQLPAFFRHAMLSAEDIDAIVAFFLKVRPPSE